MRLQIFTSGFGSSIFLRRLTSFLAENYQVKVVKEKPDIYLSSIWRGKPPKGCKIVHRVDGVYFDKLDNRRDSLNKGIQDAINGSHGVVYQSVYSKKMAYGILKVVQGKHKIIHNGFPAQLYDTVEPYPKPCDKVFLACAKWRPLKRPMSIAKGFLHADIPDSRLYMIGECKKKIKDEKIVYLDKMQANDIIPYYKMCDGLIHVSRVDACPNVVVEALCCGKPVVCNNVGGTPEIVGDSGIKLEIDSPLEYKPFKMKDPDSVSPSIIAKGLHDLLSRQWVIRREDLSMPICAKKYYDFFCEIL